MAHVRGVHETSGAQALHVVRPAKNSGALRIKLARLDHQRGLLQRQLAVWTEKQQVTKERLALVEKQIAGIDRLIRDIAGTPRRSKGRKRASATMHPPSGDAAAASRQELADLEY
jgi:hypothetical protein